MTLRGLCDGKLLIDVRHLFLLVKSTRSQLLRREARAFRVEKGLIVELLFINLFGEAKRLENCKYDVRFGEPTWHSCILSLVPVRNRNYFLTFFH